MLTKEQFAEWREHPVTKEVFAKIRELKQESIEKLVAGQTLANAADVTHGLTSRLIGEISGLNQLLELEFEDEKMEEDVNEVSGY